MRDALAIRLENAVLEHTGSEDLEHAPALLALLARRQFDLAAGGAVVCPFIGVVGHGAALAELLEHQHEFLDLVAREIVGDG